MKIIEINGLITLEADAGKVLTTMLPSSLRSKVLYLGINDSAENYTEIDEEPEIELPAEPDMEEQQEELNGYTLAEAYHQLLNENRVLKEENKKQDELIDITMMATDEMYCLLEPLLANVLLSDSTTIEPLLNMYISMVKRKLKTKEQIPIKYRKQVEEALNKEQIKEEV